MSHVASFGYGHGSEGNSDAVRLRGTLGASCAAGDFFGAVRMKDRGGFTNVVADVAFGIQSGWVDGQDAGDFVEVFDQSFAKVERLGLQEFSRGALGVEGGAIGFGNVDD